MYRTYASGKFVSNVLSFHDDFVPQICLTPDVKRWHNSVLCLDHIETFDHDFLKRRKIQEVFDTIPPTRAQWLEWKEYELGCNMFWGSWGSDFDPDRVRPAVINILQQDYRCFLMCHSFSDLDKFRCFFPNAQIIQIINDKEILAKNLMLKAGLHPGMTCPPLPENNALIKFDIGTVLVESAFFCAIDMLLQNLGLDDTTLDLRVYDYFRQYTAFY